MTNWPTAPLIRIIRGKVDGDEIANELAAHRSNGEYVLFSEKHWYWTAAANCYDDSIDEWEEVTVVPTAALKRLQQALRGVNVIKSLEPPLLEVLSYLPADKPSPLDRAVTRVKDIKGARMIDADSTQEERLSLLLDALASVQSATHKTAPLAMVTRICADWADMEGAHGDSLEVARRRVEALSGSMNFIILSALVGDVTTTMRENFSPRHDLIDASAAALAWAAQTIEEEDK